MLLVVRGWAAIVHFYTTTNGHKRLEGARERVVESKWREVWVLAGNGRGKAPRAFQSEKRDNDTPPPLALLDGPPR